METSETLVTWKGTRKVRISSSLVTPILAKKKVKVIVKNKVRIVQNTDKGTILKNIEMYVMTNMSKVLTKKLESDTGKPGQDDIFRKMIDGELKTFPENVKFPVKHEINDVIYNFKLRQMNVVATPFQAPPTPNNASESSRGMGFLHSS